MLQVHAGDDSTYIVFTYTATQTIAEGQLRFTVPVLGVHLKMILQASRAILISMKLVTASISNEDYDSVAHSVVADITLNLGDSIEIHYGAEDGGAHVPGTVPTGGSDLFSIAIRGTIDDDAAFEEIDDSDLAVRVRVQRSGGGMAEVSPMTANAGDTDKVFTITYTADGQVDAGQLRLTIPADVDWDAPTSSNVMVDGGGANTTKRYGGAHTAAELTALAAAAMDDVDLGARDVLVDNVMLAGGDTVTFTYTAAMVQATTGDAPFVVAIDGGDGPNTGPIDVSGMTTVMVEEAGAWFGYYRCRYSWDYSRRIYR